MVVDKEKNKADKVLELEKQEKKMIFIIFFLVFCKVFSGIKKMV